MNLEEKNRDDSKETLSLSSTLLLLSITKLSSFRRYQERLNHVGVSMYSLGSTLHLLLSMYSCVETKQLHGVAVDLVVQKFVQNGYML